jgi:hypothetical protein
MLIHRGVFENMKQVIGGRMKAQVQPLEHDPRARNRNFQIFIWPILTWYVPTKVQNMPIDKSAWRFYELETCTHFRWTCNWAKCIKCKSNWASKPSFLLGLFIPWSTIQQFKTTECPAIKIKIYTVNKNTRDSR